MKENTKYKIIIFDNDGVLFPNINIWMKVHQAFGTLEEGAILTKKYLDTDYNKLVEEVVNRLWKGKDATAYFDLINNIEYMQGIHELFNFLKKYEQKFNLKKAIISASSKHLVNRVADEFGFDYVYANELVIKDNVVVGEFVWPVGNAMENKTRVFHELISKLNIKPQETIYIGDSKRDVDIFREAGLSISFNSTSEELNKLANVVVPSNNLKDLIPIFKKYLS